MQIICQRGKDGLIWKSIHVGLMQFIFGYGLLQAQIPALNWGFYHRAEPLLSGHPSDYFHATGMQKPYSGIGDFSLQLNTALPKTLFHLYALNVGLTHLMDKDPAILRLQSGIQSSDKRARHSPSAIEFRVGQINHQTQQEEQIAKIENTVSLPDSKYKDQAFMEKRGLGFFVQKQGMLGTEKDGMLNIMNMFSHKVQHATESEWVPRVGIANNHPLEALHIGNKFTFHAGGASRIGDNVYYDIDNKCDKKIAPGFASSISMQHGVITLSNSTLSGTQQSASFQWGDVLTLNGIEIDHNNGMSIGKRYPNAALDIMSRTSDANTSALKIQNSNHATLMHLTSQGALGIYNAMPKEKVHIGERLTLHAGGASIIGDNLYYDSMPRALQDGQSASLSFKQGNIQLANTPFSKADASTSYAINVQDDRTIRGLTIEPVNGLCGIGTTQPKARLEVLAQVHDSTIPAFSIATLENTQYVTVTGQGNVGIGINKPKQALHVNGNVMIGNEWNDSPQCENTGNRLTVDGAIIAKEILVTVDSWADDVFEPDYKLMPLDSLERFIKEYKHLPLIPSEDQVKQEGIDMASMNAALLRKIEELTLYVIDLKHDIHALNAIMDTLPIND
jgi:hypothetical protein